MKKVKTQTKNRTIRRQLIKMKIPTTPRVKKNPQLARNSKILITNLITNTIKSVRGSIKPESQKSSTEKLISSEKLKKQKENNNNHLNPQ